MTEGALWIRLIQVKDRLSRRWETVAMIGVHFTFPQDFDTPRGPREAGLRHDEEVRGVLLDFGPLIAAAGGLDALLQSAPPFVKVETLYDPAERRRLVAERAEAEKRSLLEEFHARCMKATATYSHFGAGELWEAVRALPVEYEVCEAAHPRCGWVKFTPRTVERLEEFERLAVAAARQGDREFRAEVARKYNSPEHRRHMERVEASLGMHHAALERYGGRTLEQQADWERNWDLHGG